MRCVTHVEAQEWAKPKGLTIKGFEIEIDPNRKPRFSVQHRFPSAEVSLWRVAEAVIAWLPHESQRLLWFSRWETYPPGQVVFVEAFRRAYGERRPLFEAPGHLFEPVSYSDYEARSASVICEEASLAGLVLLILSLDWDATLLSHASSDFVAFSDGYVVFSSDLAERVAKVPAVFGLENQGG